MPPSPSDRRCPGAGEIITVMKRELVVPRAAHNVAWFHFGELCARPLAAADYLAIAERFAAVIVEGIPRSNRASVTRQRGFTS